MNKQRKVVITTTYNEMGIIIDTKVEEVAQQNLQPTCNQLATDTISRQAAIDAMCGVCSDWCDEGVCKKVSELQKLPSAQQWIPCSERLPEYGIPVLWSNEHGSVFISAITVMTDHSWAVGKRHRQSKVIAWQPLPEPYKGGEINV